MNPPRGSQHPHPLLADWLETARDPGAPAATCVVIGTIADAYALRTHADDVVHAAGPEEVPAGRTFDLVIVVDRVTRRAIPTVAGAVGGDGCLLVIAATGEPPRTSGTAWADAGWTTDLSGLSDHGLRLVAFDDLTDGGLRSPRGRRTRWLRVLYRREPT